LRAEKISLSQKMLQFTGKNKEQTGLTAANPKKPADCFQSAGLRIEFR
jgi:hypothetical protein